MGNTVGSRRALSKEQAAYIAGFLDGDGCISVKIEKRKAYTSGSVLKPRLSFSQHTRNRLVLERIREWIGSGTLADFQSKRLSELTILGKASIMKILEQILPYLIVKRETAKLMQSFLKVPLRRGMRNLDLFKERYALAVSIRNRNLTPKKYRTIPALDPVTTELERVR